MEKDKSHLRIGELLIEAQILRARELSEAIKIAKLTSLPIGRILVMSSYVGEADLQAAVKAQSLVRDGVLPLKTAILALSRMSRQECSFEDALRDVGWVQASDAKTNKLGELLRECEIISEEQFAGAMQTSTDTNLPLGRVLVSLGYLSEEVLTTALNTQVLIRDSKVSREQGLAALKAAYKRHLPLELTLSEKGFYRGPVKPTIRLGELFVLSGLISQTDVSDAVERSLMEEKLIGQTLVEQGFVNANILDMALTLQEMVANRTLDNAQAAHCLLRVQAGDQLHRVLSSLEVPESQFKVTVRLHDLLRVAGVLQHSDIELSDIDSHGKPSSQDAIRSAEKLLNNGFVDERVYHGSLRCYFLLATGWLSMQQGIIALNYFSHKEGLSFDEILADLEWTVKTRMPESPPADQAAASQERRTARGQGIKE
jgi:hypothetical protein